jgi:primosomal protein N' (replication factor Y)
VARHGAGTERIEAVLTESLDPLPIFRLDSDSASRTGAHVEILRRFDAADRGVLLGTQMVAKGHDFPDVVLGVVLDGDSSLRFPDFRAEERTFALVAQLAGRSGRGRAPGTVLVQTLAPDSPAIAFAARHDAPGFLASELERRRALRYPPYAHLVRIVCAADEAGPADRAIESLASGLRDTVPEGTDVLGPAPLFRLKGKLRRHLLLKTGDRSGTVAAVNALVEELAAGRAFSRVSVSVDVDPQ